MVEGAETPALACRRRGAAAWRELRYDEAEARTRESLALDPADAIAWCNLAAIAMDLGRFDEADKALAEALARAPDDAVALEMLATIRRHQGESGQSLRLLDHALAIDPANASAHLARALTLLAVGRFDEGWREYEWRWSEQLSGAADAVAGVPRWDGSALGTRRLFVWCDAKLGDAIQFVRFALRVQRLHPRARLALGCHEPLREWFAASLPGIELVGPGEPPGVVDLHCPLMGLPLRLGAHGGLATEGPYLRVASSAAERWRERVRRAGDPAAPLRVGLAWSGNTYEREPALYSMALRRNVALPALAPLLDDAGVQWFSLQLGAAAAEAADPPWRDRLIDWTGDLRCVHDTAALVASLDLVVCADTSVAHVAGALGRPVWMLARWDTCWRWSPGRETTAWYPSMRIFNQFRPGDWGGVAERVRGALRALVPPNRPAG